MNARITPCMATHRAHRPTPITTPTRGEPAMLICETDRRTMSRTYQWLRYGEPHERAKSNHVTTSRTAEFVRRLTAPEPAVLAQLHRPDDITTRILGATLEHA